MLSREARTALGAADELVHRDFVNHEAPPANPQGPEGLKETVSWLRGRWGPIRAEIEDEIAEDDRVAARVTMHGRNLGEFLGNIPRARSSPSSTSTSGASPMVRSSSTGRSATTSARRFSSGRSVNSSQTVDAHVALVTGVGVARWHRVSDHALARRTRRDGGDYVELDAL
jgi:hypothetical protein